MKSNKLCGIILQLCMIFCTMALVSCDGDDNNISQRSIKMYSSGGEIEVTTLDDWNATSDCPWIKILNSSGAKGESVRVVIDPNKSGVERKGIFYLENRSKTKTTNIEVLQQSVMSGKENGHEFVDLGTSVFWAKECVNINVSRANSNNSFTKEEALRLANEWGGTWRIPTAKEYKEMLELCRKGSDDVKTIIAPNGEFVELQTTEIIVDIRINQTGGTATGGGGNQGSSVEIESRFIIGGWCWTNESKKDLVLFDKDAFDIFAPDNEDVSVPLYFVLDRKN